MSRPHLADALLQASIALPNGAATVVSPAIDLQVLDGSSEFQAQTELRVAVPALTVTQLPNTQTMTYDVIESANADLSSPVVVAAGVFVQTGSGGAGAVVGSFRYRPASNASRYLGYRATNSGSGNCSSVSAVGNLVF